VIVNLHAGGGAARRRWPAVAPLLEERLGPLAAHFTEGPGHATLLAHQLAGAGFDPLIAVGGDGTLNEVVNGILSSASGVRLGVLPLASSGDFARTIGLAGLRHAVETLAAGVVREVDVVRGRFRGPAGDRRERHFVNVASFGLGGEAVDICTAIAVDASGSAFVTGATDSAHFPLAAPLKPTLTGTGHRN